MSPTTGCGDTNKERSLNLALGTVLAVSAAFAIVTISVAAKAPTEEQNARFIIDALHALVITFLTAVLALAAMLQLEENRRLTRVNEQLGALALEQQKRNVAEFRVASIEHLGGKLIRFSVTNIGWKDSAIIWCRLWPDGYDGDGLPTELELLDAYRQTQATIVAGGIRFPPAMVSPGHVATDLMVRSGDRRHFCAQVKGDENVTFKGEKAALHIAPAVGEPLLQTLRLISDHDKAVGLHETAPS